MIIEKDDYTFATLSGVNNEVIIAIFDKSGKRVIDIADILLETEVNIDLPEEMMEKAGIEKDDKSSLVFTVKSLYGKAEKIFEETKALVTILLESKRLREQEVKKHANL